jgi:hypothetical protein
MCSPTLQVVDIIKRCRAEYLRLTEYLMLLHGYQARTGVLTAGNYSAPQVWSGGEHPALLPSTSTVFLLRADTSPP